MKKVLVLSCLVFFLAFDKSDALPHRDGHRPRSTSHGNKPQPKTLDLNTILESDSSDSESDSESENSSRTSDSESEEEGRSYSTFVLTAAHYHYNGGEDIYFYADDIPGFFNIVMAILAQFPGVKNVHIMLKNKALFEQKSSEEDLQRSSDHESDDGHHPYTFKYYLPSDKAWPLFSTYVRRTTSDFECGTSLRLDDPALNASAILSEGE